MKKPTTSVPLIATNVPSQAAVRHAYRASREVGAGSGFEEMERVRVVLVRRELLSAAAPRSCARLVLDSGLPLLVKKVRFCERGVRGMRLHSGEVLALMCEMRDTDAACRGSMAAGGEAVRAAD